MPNKTKRFIVLAGARSGSTFLKNMLKSHPSVVCFGEVFNQSKIQWDMHDFNKRYNTPEIKQARDANLTGFADYVFDLASETGAQCAGFKLLYRHFGYSPAHKMLIPYLHENEDIQIIHLKRHNSFKRFCSLQIANKRVSMGKTMNAYRPDDVEEKMSIEVNPENCLTYLKKSALNAAKYDGLFANRSIHQVSYEELAANTSKVMAGILHFLDLKPAPLTINTHKVRKQPISEVVTNYDEVAAFLTDKGFGNMFAS